MKQLLFALIFTLCAFTAAAAADYNAYLGDLHSHTSFSDGEGVPDEAFDMARNDAKTDFWSVTDHYEQLDILEDLPAGDPKQRKEYDVIKERAAAMTENGKFLALAGFEWFDQSQGHMNVLNSPDVPKFGQTYNMKLFYKWVAKHPNVVAGFNHPSDSAENKWKGFDDFTYAPDVASQTIYMAINGDADFQYYYLALDKGWRLAPSGQQDNHSKNWGLHPCGCFTVVLAEKLDYNSFIDAFVNRRFYAVNNRDIRMIFTANGSHMGSKINAASVDFVTDVTLAGGGQIASVTLESNDANAALRPKVLKRIPKEKLFQKFVLWPAGGKLHF